MSVPLAILNPIFMNKSSFERNELLVHVSNTFDNLLKFLEREPMLSMTMTMPMPVVSVLMFFLLLLLLQPSRIPPNPGLHHMTSRSLHRRYLSRVEVNVRLMRTNTFLAKDFLDLAEQFLCLASVEILPDDFLE